MKKLIYQLFIVEYGKVEIFFLLSVFTSFAFYPNYFAGAISAFFLPLFFIRKKSGIIISLAILGLYLFASSALLITGEKQGNGGKHLYSTTSGTLVTEQKLNAGDVVFGKIDKRTYSGEGDSRFARGYNIADEELSVMSVPLLSGVLSFRQRLSDEFFEKTGGELRLTQGIMLGDKQYLENGTKDKYLLTGLAHLLAISGLHVGLYAMVCYFLFGFLPYKLRLIPAGLMLLLLIPFTGFKIPVLRAGLIGFSIVTARFLDFSTDYRKLLLFFAGIFVLVSPSMIASPSFILSFSAVYGLLYMNQLRLHRYFTPFTVGLVSTAFILPASSALFGSVNVSSVITTPILIPVVSAQLICFLIYLIAPSIALEPLILLEKIHLWLMDVFAGYFDVAFTLYKTELIFSLLMFLFLYLCVRLRIMWFAMLVLLIPHIPTKPQDGAYFPNMGRSKGFVVVADKTHIFYKGHHSDFMYRFIPYLAKIGVESADTGTINVYGSDNIFIPIAEEGEDYGGVCVNSVDETCKAIYHTRSNSYKCDDDRIHILYKNRCVTDNTYLISKTGDLVIENFGEREGSSD